VNHNVIASMFPILKFVLRFLGASQKTEIAKELETALGFSAWNSSLTLVMRALIGS
jgi:hypothetical protein